MPEPSAWLLFPSTRVLGCPRMAQAVPSTVPTTEMLLLVLPPPLPCSPELLGLLWVISLLKDRRDVALWLSQVSVVALTAPHPCPQGSEEHPRGSAGTCPGFVQPKLNSGATRGTGDGGNELGRGTIDLGGFWCRGALPAGSHTENL